jgi:hypothetical protein
MNHPTLTLRADVPGTASYWLGDEIWQVSLGEAIAVSAGAELLKKPSAACREALRTRVIGEMTAGLIAVGDTYTAPDGVRSALTAGPTDTESRS